ncbi:MAG: PH domain-containing protein [Deltaproteobacteria bacterium]|nr:PH domain-containing protein [Deltaproteobacteria bacterium]
MAVKQIVIPKVWRSEIKLLTAFFLLGVASIFLTRQFPGSIISGRLFSLGDKVFYLSLPLFWFMPFFALLTAVVRIYNVRYIIDSRGLEAQIGLLSPKRLYQRRIFFADIRSAETEQTILERVLNVGAVEIGTAATADIEIIFEGVAAPQELQGMIQRERDRSLRSAQASA